MSFAQRAFHFFQTLAQDQPIIPASLHIKIINPYCDAAVMEAVQAFLFRYYDDDNPRVLIAGINPGRYGGGLTGISFTDPVALRHHCDIDHRLKKRQELSSSFIYRVIEHMGGASRFFQTFFLTALCPLGFLRNGRNYNYYDDPRLLQAVSEFIEKTFMKQVQLGVRRDVFVVLGGDKNFRMAQRLNDKYRWFERLLALEHPRFIMQYRRRHLSHFVNRYVEQLSALIPSGQTTTYGSKT
ncbi:MAG: DUF4918 family protein [Chitinophagales bacterium]|nr:DUF4918 family protein [Chitinophagales bacterium]MDW8426951.1 DUF4918 family protein [Chitinophagales bacterium]